MIKEIQTKKNIQSKEKKKQSEKRIKRKEKKI